MRTIIAISLLILLAAVACGSEAPGPVATTEPTATVASSLPGKTPVPSPTAELPAYTITEVDDVSFGSTRRLSYKVKTVAALSDAQIKEVAESIIDARHRQDDLVNALSFMFYFPGNQRPVPNIVLNWAPGGDWGKANTVKSGEYKTFAFDLIDNRLIVETLSELYPATPESTTTATLEPTATPEPTLTPTPSLEWYEGGTLHEGTIGEWKRASAHDWLATAADFAYLLLQDQGHDLTSIGGLDGLRPYAEDIVTCVNESTVGLDALDDSLKTAETALLCVTLMGSQWGIRD